MNLQPKISTLCVAFLQKAPEFCIHFLTTLPLTETLLKALQQGLVMKSADAMMPHLYSLDWNDEGEMGDFLHVCPASPPFNETTLFV